MPYQPETRMMSPGGPRFSFFTSASRSLLSSLDFTADQLSNTQRRASKFTYSDQATHHSTASTSGPSQCIEYYMPTISTSRHVRPIRYYCKQSKRISSSSTNYSTKLISLPATAPSEPSRCTQQQHQELLRERCKFSTSSLWLVKEQEED